MKKRKLNTGNYFGHYKGYYFFLRKREHGKWDGFGRYVSWWTGTIGKNGEWLFSEGMFTSRLKTLKIAFGWVRFIVNSNPAAPSFTN